MREHNQENWLLEFVFLGSIPMHNMLNLMGTIQPEFKYLWGFQELRFLFQYNLVGLINKRSKEGGELSFLSAAD